MRKYSLANSSLQSFVNTSQFKTDINPIRVEKTRLPVSQSFVLKLLSNLKA